MYGKTGEGGCYHRSLAPAGSRQPATGLEPSRAGPPDRNRSVMTHSAEPLLRHVTCAHPGGLHRLAYWQWGETDNPSVVMCVHGLTRTGRDFDALARRLAHMRDNRAPCT